MQARRRHGQDYASVSDQSSDEEHGEHEDQYPNEHSPEQAQGRHLSGSDDEFRPGLPIEPGNYSSDSEEENEDRNSNISDLSDGDSSYISENNEEGNQQEVPLREKLRRWGVIRRISHVALSEVGNTEVYISVILQYMHDGDSNFGKYFYVF